MYTKIGRTLHGVSISENEDAEIWLQSVKGWIPIPSGGSFEVEMMAIDWHLLDQITDYGCGREFVGKLAWEEEPNQGYAFDRLVSTVVHYIYEGCDTGRYKPLTGSYLDKRPWMSRTSLQVGKD